jgi:hypothetical protein
LPIIKRYGEEKCPAWDEIAPILDHIGSLSRISLRCVRHGTEIRSPDGATRNPG